MAQRYELHAGRRPVAVRAAPSAQVALLDYLRSLGCRDDELTRLGSAAIAWRGAVYEALPNEETPSRG
ncbi:MAG: hypothetical protein KatS3mg012_0547 [Gaiellaceae bacterium]|jgi:hypothetical protein|nr:MAG: hypothetical protein KatS3mg012_0547 [Gaiellaceae bacterium]